MHEFKQSAYDFHHTQKQLNDIFNIYNKHTFTCIFKEPVYNTPLTITFYLIGIVNNRHSLREQKNYKLHMDFHDNSGYINHQAFLGYFAEPNNIIRFVEHIFYPFAIESAILENVLVNQVTRQNLFKGLRNAMIKVFGA